MNWHWELILSVGGFLIVCVWVIWHGYECDEHEWVVKLPVEFEGNQPIINEFCNRCGRKRHANGFDA